MIFSFTTRDPLGGRYAPTAFDSQIGKQLSVRVGEQTLTGTLVDAVVGNEGVTADLTIDCPALSPAAVGYQ